jgi:hypothetical protein
LRSHFTLSTLSYFLAASNSNLEFSFAEDCISWLGCTYAASGWGTWLIPSLGLFAPTFTFPFGCLLLLTYHTANNAHRIPNAPKLTPTPIPTFLPNSSFPGVGTPLAPDELLLIVDGIEFVGDDIEEKDVWVAMFQPFKCTADMYDPAETVDTEVPHTEATTPPLVIYVICATLKVCPGMIVEMHSPISPALLLALKKYDLPHQYTISMYLPGLLYKLV